MGLCPTRSNIYPEQRLQYILEDASIQLFVTQESLKELNWLPENVESICPDAHQDEIGKESKTLPVSGAHPQNLAYVIYTSDQRKSKGRYDRASQCHSVI